MFQRNYKSHDIRARGSDDFTLQKEEDSMPRSPAQFPELQGLVLFKFRVLEAMAAHSDVKLKLYMY